MTISSLPSPFGTGASGASAYSSGNAKVSATTQAILDAVAKATGGTTSSAASGNGVSISTDAKLAAADAADNVRDFGELTTEVRAELDKGDADVTEMSGRALAAIVLNRSNNFSRTEIAAAKKELDGRTREDFALLAGGGNVLGGLSAYNQQLVSQYDSMSDEEREARGWTPAMRASAEAFVNSSQNIITSLFDQLNQDE